MANEMTTGPYKIVKRFRVTVKDAVQAGNAAWSAVEAIAGKPEEWPPASRLVIPTEQEIRDNGDGTFDVTYTFRVFPDGPGDGADASIIVQQ